MYQRELDSRMNIEASRCSKCERVTVPPRSICPYCSTNAEPMDRIDLNDKGSILSYSVLEVPTEGFNAPLLLALVELEHGAVVLSMGDRNLSESVNIGTNVRLSTDDIGRFKFSLTE
ncbi:MAG: zinc ribbon domain-containing protein [Candidatus Thorarchaeota archaeon]